MNHHQQQQRRRRQQQQHRRPTTTATTVLTAVGVAYASYRLTNWAYKRWNNSSGDEEQEGGGGDGGGGTSNQRQAQQQQQPSTSIVEVLLNQMISGVFTSGLNNNDGFPSQSSPNNNSHYNTHNKWKLRRQHIQKCHAEIQTTLNNLLPSMKEIIEEQTDTTKEIKLLKRLRKEQKKRQERLQSDPPPPTTTIVQDPKSNNNNDKEKEKQTNHHQEEEGEEESNNNNNNDDEYELWEIIKINSITRMIVTAYAYTILYLILCIQIHLLGGKLFHSSHDDSSSPSSSSSSSSSPSSLLHIVALTHEKVLIQTYQYFLEYGIKDLIKIVKDVVTNDVFYDWDVLDSKYIQIDKETFDNAINEVRNIIEEKEGRGRGGSSGGQQRGMTRRRENGQHQQEQRRRRRKCFNLQRFVIAPEYRYGLSSSLSFSQQQQQQQQHHHSGEEQEQYIVDETLDIIESPLFVNECTNDCFDKIFNILIKENKYYFWNDDDDDNNGGEKNTTKPLATIITQIQRHACNSFYDTTTCSSSNSSDSSKNNDVLYSSLENIPSVLELGDVCFN